jgi:hypothetical protein
MRHISRLIRDSCKQRRLLLTCIILLLGSLFYFRYHIQIYYLQSGQLFSRADSYVIFNDNSMDVILNRTVPNKFVIMSVSMVEKQNFYYVLYLPICALAWRRIGYEPLVFIVKDSRHEIVNDLTGKTIQYLKKFNVRVIDVAAEEAYVRNVAMLVRLFVGILPDDVAKDDDFIMTSDTDFIPISKTYFNFLNTDAITLLDARERKFIHKGVPYEMPEVFIPYIGMKKWRWREVMRLKKAMELKGSTVVEKVKEIHGETSFVGNSQMMRGDNFWFLDQRTVTIALNEYLKSSSSAKLNRFAYSGMRLDRSWPKLWYLMLERFDHVTDAHLFHADAFEYQEFVFDLLRRLFGRNLVKIIGTYFEEFRKLLL